MATAILVIYRVLSILLYAFDFLLLARAVCSWVPDFRSSRIYNLSFAITEPVLKPIRKLMWKWDFARRCPLDLSFLAVCILTTLLDRLLARLFIYLITII